MKPTLQQGTSTISAICPTCGIPTSFEWHHPGAHSSELGAIILDKVQHRLYRCTACGQPGVATLNGSDLRSASLREFFPSAVAAERLPEKLPDGVRNEFREAEKDMAAKTWRSAAALLRSTLEKVLEENGYDKGALFVRIEQARDEQTITAARARAAHDHVRTLGNDVLHEPWREVDQAEAEAAHRYVARIIEDFYDQRPSVEAHLTTQKRKFNAV
jgi:uncharacterized membrane protein